MIAWIIATVPYFKAIHIVALCVWSAGLLAMPLMLARADPGAARDDQRWVRPSLHFTYTMIVTPAAVTAVIAGTWLIFLRGTFELWLYAKLFFVVFLVLGHVLIGHVLTREESGLPAEAGGGLAPLVSYAAVVAISLCSCHA